MSEQLFLEAFNSEPYFFEKEEKYGAMDIIYTFEDEAGHGFKFHFEKKVALGKHAYVCVLSQKTPGLKTYKRVIGKFSNPMRTVATLLAVVRDIHDTRKDVHGIVMSIPEQAFGSYARLVKKIMTRELRTVLNVEDGEYTPEDFEKMGLVGIVTTVKPRNMNTVYTGPALKEYQERQAAKGVASTAVVPAAKESNIVLAAKASINKTGSKIIFEPENRAQVIDISNLKDKLQALASKYKSVTPHVEMSGIGFTAKNVLENLKAANELTADLQKEGYVIKVTAEDALSSIGFKLSELKVKFSLTGVDASNAKLSYTENGGESLKLLALSMGWSAIGGNGSYSLMSYKGDIEELRSSLKEYGKEEKSTVADVPPVEDDNLYRKLEVNILRTNIEDSVRFEIVNRFSRAEMYDGEELIKKLHSNILSSLAKLMQVVPGFIMRQVILGDSGEVELRFETKYLPKILELIKKTVGNKARFVGLERLEDLAPKQPVVDPVAEKEAFYFDYDHRQITLTFDNAETAGRIKDQLLELGAATFNDSEFFTDKEKLILLDDKSLDVKKVQATLFPILGQPVLMNGVSVDPNVTTSVRSPDGVTYKIKGNTIQVEDAPKDTAMVIIRELLPMADRIFDDKGSNTLELNSQGIADGFSIDNIAPVLKKSNLAKRLSAKLFRSWENAVTEASNKYELSTGDFGSSFTNNSSYLIDIATSGVVGEYTRTAGNVISGIVLKSNYKIREAVAKPLVALGFTVEYDVQGWRTQVKLPVNSDYTIPGTSELALFIKEVDNLANIARNRTVEEYVGGNKNFRAKWNPDSSRVFLILPTAESSGLGWRDYTAYATAPEYVRVDNIESYEEFLKLTEFVKNFDFGANLLRNIGVSKYLSDVRSGGAKASKSYKLKDGGEVEISFKFGDKVTFIFNQNSEGFDKEMSEFADEKIEIFGRTSAILLYMLGTADANKTLKNIDAWLDAHIVSKEDNTKPSTPSGDGATTPQTISGTLEINADVGAFDNYALIVQDGKLYVKKAYGQLMERDYWRFAPKGMTYSDADDFVKSEILKLYNSGAKKSEIETKVGEWLKGRGRVVSINDERTGGAPKKNILNPLLSALKTASSTGKEKKVTGVDLRVGKIRSYDGNTGRLGDLLFVQGAAVDEVYEALKKAGAMSLIRGFSKTGSVEIEFESVERKVKKKLIFTSSGVEGSFDRLKSAMIPINYGELIRFVSKGVRDSSPEYLANEFMDFIGAPNLRFKVGKNTLKRCLTLADDVAGLTNALKGSEILLESFETGDEMNEGIKEDLTGKAPNRVTKKALTEAMRGFNSAQFTYGGAILNCVIKECAVEIVPTSGNIRNFAKMLGARLGQELRIDDEGFLSFDLDNI